MPPLRNSADSHVAELRNFGAAAKRINDLVRVHDTNLSALRPLNASTLRCSARVTFKQYAEEDGRRWQKPLIPMHPPTYDELEALGTVFATYAVD